ncbi:MAG: GNAT family N-acetyltransferase [Rhodocyclaceae bacterium]|nr:GNAT family N-acetyltransferase [Rhodocyclaceae bacterium]
MADVTDHSATGLRAAVLEPFRSHEWVNASAVCVGGSSCDAGPDLVLLRRTVGLWKVAGLPLPKSATPMSAGLGGTPIENDAALWRLAAWFQESDLSLLQVTSATPPPEGLQCSRVEMIENLEIPVGEHTCESLWSRMSKLPQRQIRRALKAGVRVHRVAPSVEHLARLRSLSSAIYASTHERPIHDPRQHAAMATEPLSKGLTMFAVSICGETLGYLLSVQHAGRSYYWDVAVDEKGRGLGAGHLLVWIWMRWCKRRGVGIVDFIGPPEGGRAGGRPGIGRFKVSFGAVARPYWVVYWTRHGAGFALDCSRFLAMLRRRLLDLRLPDSPRR